jgi:LPXTG-motif cell wall-anchored protein
MRRDHLVRRLVAATALLFAVLLATPGMSAAAPYPAPAGPGVVSSGTLTLGDTVTFSGTGFLPGEPIVIGIGYGQSGDMLGQTTATLTGDFSIVVEPPRVGPATLVAIGETSGVRVSAAIRVLAVGADNGTGTGTGTGPGSDGTDGRLPVTGTDTGVIALGGAAMLALGVALVGFTATRRRRTAEI